MSSVTLTSISISLYYRYIFTYAQSSQCSHNATCFNYSGLLSGTLYCTHACVCAHTHTHTHSHTVSNSSVDIVTGLQIGQSWFNIRDFLFSKAPRLVLGPTSPLNQELLGTLATRVGQWVRNWPPTCTWSYTSTPLACLHGVDRDTFTFTITYTISIYIQELCVSSDITAYKLSYLKWTNSYKNYHIRELKKVQNCYTITILAQERNLLLHKMRCSQSRSSLLPSQVWWNVVCYMIIGTGIYLPNYTMLHQKRP